MAQVVGRPGELFSARAFLLGLSVVLGLYLLLLGVLGALADRTVDALEGRLASQSVVIDYIETAANPSSSPAFAVPAPVAQADPSASMEDEIKALTGGGASSATGAALEAAPIEGVFEETPHGILPVVHPGGLSPFKAYRKPFTFNRDKPVVGLAVMDFGLSAALSQKALEVLPPEVSLILTPYSIDPAAWQQKAREDGHEIWLQLMVQNGRFPDEDPGAKALMTHVSLKFNQERYFWTLGRTAGYAGIAAYTDATLKSAGPMFKALAEDMFKRGLGYFELSPERYSYFEPYAIDAQAPAAHNNFLLRTFDPQSDDVKAVMRALEDGGGVVVTVVPTAKNLEALVLWIKSLGERGVAIAPLSAVAALSNEG